MHAWHQNIQFPISHSATSIEFAGPTGPDLMDGLEGRLERAAISATTDASAAYSSLQLWPVAADELECPLAQMGETTSCQQLFQQIRSLLPDSGTRTTASMDALALDQVRRVYRSVAAAVVLGRVARAHPHLLTRPPPRPGRSHSAAVRQMDFALKFFDSLCPCLLGQLERQRVRLELLRFPRSRFGGASRRLFAAARVGAHV